MKHAAVLAAWLACAAPAAADPIAAADERPPEGFDWLARGAGDDELGWPEARAFHCTFDRRWCAQLSEASGALVLVVVERTGRRLDQAMRSWALPLPPLPGEPGLQAIWPNIRLDGDEGVLLGIDRQYTASFGSGRMQATNLVLVRLPPDRSALAIVAEVPVAVSRSVRACADEAQRTARAGACSDEYQYNAHVAAEPVAGWPARLRVSSSAFTHRGDRFAADDGRPAAALRRDDEILRPDRACSYSRTLTFDPAAGRYAQDRPARDCERYFATGPLPAGSSASPSGR